MRKPFTRLYCHLVWATWDRLPLIRPEDEPRLYGAIKRKIRELGAVPVALGGTHDHVHCLVSIGPTLSIAYLVQQVKGASSHLMTHEVMGSDRFKWQGAYGAFTVSPEAIPTVEAYIRNQKQHHDCCDLHEEWEQTWYPDDEAPGTNRSDITLA
ncbi:MAG: IS200/IS605 family transposase [Pseudarthrobacter sp.]